MNQAALCCISLAVVPRVIYTSRRIGFTALLTHAHNSFTIALMLHNGRIVAMLHIVIIVRHGHFHITSIGTIAEQIGITELFK